MIWVGIGMQLVLIVEIEIVDFVLDWDLWRRQIGYFYGDGNLFDFAYKIWL